MCGLKYDANAVEIVKTVHVCKCFEKAEIRSLWLYFVGLRFTFMKMRSDNVA